MRGVTFVLVGDDRRHRRFVRKFWKEAQAAGVDALFRMVGHHADMPAAYAASDIVVVPYTSRADLRPRGRRGAGDGAAGDRIGGRARCPRT